MARKMTRLFSIVALLLTVVTQNGWARYSSSAVVNLFSETDQQVSNDPVGSVMSDVMVMNNEGKMSHARASADSDYNLSGEAKNGGLGLSAISTASAGWQEFFTIRGAPNRTPIPLTFTFDADGELTTSSSPGSLGSLALASLSFSWDSSDSPRQVYNRSMQNQAGIPTIMERGGLSLGGIQSRVTAFVKVGGDIVELTEEQLDELGIETELRGDTVEGGLFEGLKAQIASKILGGALADLPVPDGVSLDVGFDVEFFYDGSFNISDQIRSGSVIFVNLIAQAQATPDASGKAAFTSNFSISSVSVPFDFEQEFGIDPSTIIIDFSNQEVPVRTAMRGDVNYDAVISNDDFDLLQEEIRGGQTSSLFAFDLDRSETVDQGDMDVLVRDVAGTWYGDSNLDGEFASDDLVAVFQAAEYEDDIDGNSTWSEGDWNSNGDFESSDLIVAFQDAGFEMGTREPAAVPEPTSGLLFLIGLLAFTKFARK